MMQKINKELILERNPLMPWFIRMHLTDTLLNAHWGRNNARYWKQVESTGIMKQPQVLWFEPTVRCNLSCCFCYQHTRRQVKTQELDTAAIKRLFEQCATHGIRMLNMYGGEVFVRSDMFDMLDTIQRLGLRVKIGSNGTLIDSSVANRLKRYNCIENITVSVDGPEAVHDDLRGVPGVYKKIVQGLRLLVKQNFATAVCSVITPQELSVIDSLMSLSRELSLDRLVFLPEVFYSSADIDSSRKILHLSENGEPFFVQKKDNVDIAAHVETMLARLRYIEKQRVKHGVFVSVIPRAAQKFPREFFSGELRGSSRLMCRQMSLLNVFENGNVRICPFINVVCGNIINQSIEEIWNNEIMRNLRTAILGANLLPICSRCCSADYI